MPFFDPNNPSPLDDIRIQEEYEGVDLNPRNRSKPRANSLLHDQQSLISFDSIQTADRLLDKLDLSIEDELLLQQALREEEEERRIATQEYPDDIYFSMTQSSRPMIPMTTARPAHRPVLCIPASSFPSLRHAGGTARHKTNVAPPVHQSSHAILEDLNDNEKLVSSKGNVVEDHISKFRYSYLVQEGSGDEAEDTPQNEDGSETLDALQIEKYRRKLAQTNRYYGTGSSPTELTHGSGSASVSNPQSRAKSSTHVLEQATHNETASSHTPSNSVSSLALQNHTTASSFESDLTARTAENGPNNGSSTLLSTPKTSRKSLECDSPGHPSSPSIWNKGHKKKNSFSLKNLFKSPKVTSETESSPKADNSSNEEHDAAAYSEQMPPITAPSAHRQSEHHHHSASAYPKKPLQKLQHSYKLLIEPRPMLPVVRSDEVALLKHRRSASLPKNGPRPGTQRDPNTWEQQDRATLLQHAKILQQQKQLPQISSSHSHAHNKRPPVPPKDIPVGSQQPKMHTQQGANKMHKPATSVVQRTGSLGNKRVPDPPLPVSADGRLTPEQKVQLALELRNRRQYAECTKLLREACEAGDRTGFLLYGLALRHGSGIPTNLPESFKWIFKASGVKDEAAEVLSLNIDPFKLKNVPLVPPEPEAPALYECGISYLKGYGFAKPDELKGLKYLEQAASLGHIDSICLCGTIWSKRSRNRPRDSCRAAAWFRIADAMGADLIGANWIYKEKYMRPSPESSAAVGSYKEQKATPPVPTKHKP
ncbi:AER010Cp [Eremothecium gossypii ATCC 10895]|uniref:AER010Cp n=1 Tax=Eremothecium gossypii (strain ATCC 10895 / CBS 109.51 / FGSC 9923 / NRRL Y-1056) TaxID=284811 RepID=Q757K2_EREGS|nr:AER010Cp [Eremothecium gossypii ATCC 10895]AAS52694.2 AER010Cp [Eremothecium gossypii ATCC 10895]AEY96999.1 FAER010Cp [Eremothecium gossypii FDAG1]